MWHWQTQDESSYLICEALAPFRHGFFTQHWSPQRPQDLVVALDPDATVCRVKQVHGNRVLPSSDVVEAMELKLSDETPEPVFPIADGILSDRPHHAVWVCSADCVPALIADPITGQVAAVHAGWRGTAARILPNAIAQLQAQGSQLSNLQIALGPAIAGEVYQVSSTVGAAVALSLLPNFAEIDILKDVAISNQSGEAEQRSLDPLMQQLDNHPDHRNQILTTAQRWSPSPILPDEQPDRVRLDVRLINLLQLQSLGISSDQVAIAPYCTYQNSEQFFSYRRTRKKNVQWSGIVSQAQHYNS